MAQLQIKNLSKSYGPNSIFENVTSSFSTEQKIGVIGRNGAGKSTLCKILMGQEEMDDGEICKSSDLRLSYLEQHDPFKPGETVSDFLTRYTEKPEWECSRIAYRFQITHKMMSLPISSLSGGYQTRVKLTAMLLKDPNFLILDEPTNFLDLNTLILLENFLQDFDGGYLIVSHDREFLKRTANHTLETENGELTLFAGNVEDYLAYKEEEKRQAISYNKSVEVKKRELQNFVDRFRANASKAGLAQSKMKLIEKLETIEIAHTSGTVRMKIPSVESRTGIALRCKNLTIGYPEKTVAMNIDFEIDRGKHVAVLGENGQGKTTFMKTLAGNLSPLSGEFSWTHGSKIAYYAQHVLSMLDPKDTVYSHLKRMAAPGILHQDILNIAGSFLFSGDDVEKLVSVLSGGEKARLCLAGLLLTKSNILLLDEPTNHLDFETVEALGHALRKFQGTLFFICHDRTFVNLVATQILDVKNGQVVRYPGKYEEYVYVLEKQAREGIHEKNVSSDETSPAAEKKQKAETAESSPLQRDSLPLKLSYLERKSLKSELNKIEKRIAKVEEKLVFYNAEKRAIETQFEKEPGSWSRKLSEKLDLLKKMLSQDEDVLLELTEQKEKILGRLN